MEKMKGLNSWARGIIIAIIVTSILQMILPDNKTKKYVNIVMGIYVLFCIISPVLGKNISLENISVEEYANIGNLSRQEEVSNYNSNVKETFKNKVIYNIQSQLKAKGYEAESINISIDDEYNVTKIQISKVYESKDNNGNKSSNENKSESKDISINKIETNVNNVETGVNNKKIWGMTTSDEDSIKKILSESYRLDEDNIIIE